MFGSSILTRMSHFNFSALQNLSTEQRVDPARVFSELRWKKNRICAKSSHETDHLTQFNDFRQCAHMEELETSERPRVRAHTHTQTSVMKPNDA